MFGDTALAAIGGLATKYGSLADTVKGVGFLLAAILTISLGWMKRSGSSWVPPEEAVPKATTRFASLITAVLLAFIYVFLHQPERIPILAIVTFLSLVISLTGLLFTTYVIKAYGFPATRRNWRGKEIHTIKLGGIEFTHDAAEAIKIRNVDADHLLQEAQGDLNLVFTKISVAKIHLSVTASFLALQSFGSLALGGAGLLFSLAS